jgi:hydrogenase maturation protease
MSEAAGRRALVVGLGNPLMGDDGLGLAALARLAQDWDLPPTVEPVDGGTWGLELLPRFEEATHVLLLDAVDAGRDPGTPVELEREDLPRLLGHKLSPHQIELREVLALAELRGTLPASLACLGLQPASVELRAGLSPALTAGLGQLAASAAARLRAWGFPVLSRLARAHA